MHEFPGHLHSQNAVAPLCIGYNTHHSQFLQAFGMYTCTSPTQGISGIGAMPGALTIGELGFALAAGQGWSHFTNALRERKWTHLNSCVALALLRQKFISDRIGVCSPLLPPGQNPPSSTT